ncbi:MAG: 30S ribosomal protein S4 [Candidatus Portnoybacteria bacterium]|nr:30S ribosomal protein S4 [Candidatus Portnoybacteria bacterium]
MYKGPTRKFKRKGIKRRQTRLTEYGQQLLEKQKLKKYYNLREKTLKNYFKQASRKKVDVDMRLTQLLERRLDNVVYRLGWALTRPQAGQLVSHGHVLAGSKTVKISSYQVREGETIEIKSSKKDRHLFRDLPIKLEKYEPPSWLRFTAKDRMTAEAKSLPVKEHFTEPVDLSLVLQFYSR